jgi:hypothetical protein
MGKKHISLKAQQQACVLLFNEGFDKQKLIGRKAIFYEPACLQASIHSS